MTWDTYDAPQRVYNIGSITEDLGYRIYYKGVTMYDSPQRTYDIGPITEDL